MEDKILVLGIKDFAAKMDLESKEAQGPKVVVRFDSYEEFCNGWKNLGDPRNLHSLWLRFEDNFLSELSIDEHVPIVPIILYCKGIGDRNAFLDRLPEFRRLNLRCCLPCEDLAFQDLKILSSLGISTALRFEKEDGVIDAEKFLDFASYALVSPMPHAPVEPFDYILRMFDRQNENIDFSAAYYIDPKLYIHINGDGMAAYSQEALAKGNFAGSLDGVLENPSDYEDKYVNENYYNHFIALDHCSKCSSFKICNRTLENLFENCEGVMAEVYSLCELRRTMDQKRNSQDRPCQL